MLIFFNIDYIQAKKKSQEFSVTPSAVFLAGRESPWNSTETMTHLNLTETSVLKLF